MGGVGTAINGWDFDEIVWGVAGVEARPGKSVSGTNHHSPMGPRSIAVVPFDFAIEAKIPAQAK